MIWVDGDWKEINGSILTIRLFCHDLYTGSSLTIVSQHTLIEGARGDKDSTPVRDIHYGTLYSRYFLAPIPAGREVYSNQALWSIFSKCFLKGLLIVLVFGTGT